MGPIINTINIDNTLNIMITQNKNALKVSDSVFNVPQDGSIYNFVLKEPTIINAAITGINLPNNIGMHVVRFQYGVLFPKPENSDPLPAIEDTYS